MALIALTTFSSGLILWSGVVLVGFPAWIFALILVIVRFENDGSASDPFGKPCCCLDRRPHIISITAVLALLVCMCLFAPELSFSVTRKAKSTICDKLSPTALLVLHRCSGMVIDYGLYLNLLVSRNQDTLSRIQEDYIREIHRLQLYKFAEMGPKFTLLTPDCFARGKLCSILANSAISIFTRSLIGSDGSK
jgi:hypothetical protein